METIDLLGIREATTNDRTGLRAYLQQLVGQPFQFFRESYGDELTLHFGVLLPNHPKLKRAVRGSYVLSLRGSPWGVFSGTRKSLTLHLSSESETQDDSGLAELERQPPIQPGAVVLAAIPYPSADLGGTSLMLHFSDGSRLMVQGSPNITEDKQEQPPLADWELFTPYNRCLRVGPGLTWAYSAGREELEKQELAVHGAAS